MARLIAGALLFPFSLSSVAAALQALADAGLQARRTWPFLVGAAAYPIVSGLFGLTSTRLYVLGHELSHAFAAWMSGGKVFSFFVSSRGGRVDLSHSNAWIALAPYIVPIYTALVVISYRLFIWLANPKLVHAVPAYEIFLFLVGASVSFHIIHTFDAIYSEKQPDLRQAGGVVFSLAVILIANGIMVLVLLKSLFARTIRLTTYFWLIWHWASLVFRYVAAAAAKGAR